MNTAQSFESDAMQRPAIRRRLFFALLASLAIHAAIVLWFQQTRLPQFNAPVERLVPRMFNVKNITVDDKLLAGADQEQVEAQKKVDEKPVAKPLQIPDDKPIADVTDGRMAPAAPTAEKLVKPLANDKPQSNSNDVATIARVEDGAEKAMEQDLNSLKDSLLKDQPSNVSHPSIRLPEMAASANQNDAAGMAAASGRLDTLLGHGIHSGDAPVTMPGGAMFEFGSADLLSDAVGQLRKLGLLIKKSPDVTFSIEGYTDSFGDAEFNKQLSQERADAVRTWLIQNMDVDPGHIQAVGYGATNFVKKPQPVDMHSQQSIDAEKLLEQANRRVEIRFKFPKAK